jgi:hypothetical protein
LTEAAPGRRALWTALLVAGTAWSAHFLFFPRFSLYEDDIRVVGPLLNWSWRDALSAAVTTLRTLNQGRPIGFLIATVVPFTCFQLGGVRALPLVYLAASAIVVANALLAHRLFKRVYGPSFALLAALLFTLYPADTTHTYLTHALVLQPALTLVLLALLAYTGGRSARSYVLAGVCLLTYESAILAFLAAPLLTATWEPGLLRRWARHIAVVLAIVGAVIALRMAVGEGRAVDLEHEQGVGWSQVPGRVLQSLAMGPPVSLSAFVTRPAWAMAENMDAGLALGIGAAFLAMVAILGGSGFATAVAARPVLLRAAATGLVMLVGGYAFEFPGWHFPPVHGAGRMSAVHMGATIGAALFVAALLSLAWTLVRRRSARIAAGVLVAFYLASLFGYRLVVQRGFVSAAQQQRDYWSRIVALVPDLSADTVVVLLGTEPTRNGFILPSSWSDTWVIKFLFRDARGRSPVLVGGSFPLRSEQDPSVFDESLVEARDGRLWWSREVPPWMRVDGRAPLMPGKLVVLEYRDWAWKRRAGTITLRGIDVDLTPPPPGAAIRLAPGPLHDLLLPRGAGGAPSAAVE